MSILNAVAGFIGRGVIGMGVMLWRNWVFFLSAAIGYGVTIGIYYGAYRLFLYYGFTSDKAHILAAGADMLLMFGIYTLWVGEGYYQRFVKNK